MGQDLGPILHKTWPWKRYLEGLRYPVVKDEIACKAKRMNAPDELLDLIAASPERRYEKLEDIIQVFDALALRGEPEVVSLEGEGWEAWPRREAVSSLSLS